MAVTSIARDSGIGVNIVRMVCSDTLSQVATAGYLTAQADNIAALNNGVWEWQDGDMVLVYASDGDGFFTPANDNADLDLYSTAGNGAVTLPVVGNNFTVFDGTLGALKDLGFSASDASKTKVVMANGAVVANKFAVFTDTAGTIDDTAVAATHDGDIISTGLLTGSAANALTAHAGGGQGSALALTKQINRVTTVASAGDSVKLPASAAGQFVVVVNAAAANAMDCFPASGEAINALSANTALSIAANKTVVFFCAVAGTWNSILTA